MKHADRANRFTKNSLAYSSKSRLKYSRDVRLEDDFDRIFRKFFSGSSIRGNRNEYSAREENSSVNSA